MGNIRKVNIKEVLYKLEKDYWTLMKDKPKKCKDCELKCACFGCREIAWRRLNN